MKPALSSGAISSYFRSTLLAVRNSCAVTLLISDFGKRRHPRAADALVGIDLEIPLTREPGANLQGDLHVGNGYEKTSWTAASTTVSPRPPTMAPATPATAMLCELPAVATPTGAPTAILASGLL